jgi:D-3-phosphoglycerate dehydrogenase / 2-oxoglutarate reductase
VSKPVVLIAEELSPATIDALGPDFDVRQVDGTDRPALLSALADAHAILIRSATKVDAEAIAAAPILKVVARAGVGLDNVDIKAATAAGVMVVNAPTSNIISAAELTIGHILSLARHIPAAHASLAAEMMLEVGALTTMTPAAVAALMSTLSSPTPARM